MDFGDYEDDFDDAQMVESITVSPASGACGRNGFSSSATVDDLEEVDGPGALGSPGIIGEEMLDEEATGGFIVPLIKRVAKPGGGRRALPSGPMGGSISPGLGSPQRLRVGTPGVAMGSRSSSAMARRSDDATGYSSDIEEERDDVDHVIAYRPSGAAKAAASGGFRIKTFREVNGSERRQFDGSCVLLGAGLDGGGHVYAVHRYPIAAEDATEGTGISADGQLAPSVVRTLRTRLQQLARMPPHPHVLRCHGATMKDGAIFCPTDFAAGGSLLDVVKRERVAAMAEGAPPIQQLPEELARLLFHHVLRGLRHMHAHGTAHGALHLRSVFVHESVGSPGAGLSAADDDGLLVDDDDDANAAGGLVGSLGAFGDAVTRSSATSQPPHHHHQNQLHARQRSGNLDADESLEDPSAAFSPARSSRLGGRSRSRERSTLITPGADDDGATDVVPAVSGGAGAPAASWSTPEALGNDLQALSRLFTAMFRGFTSTGDPNDMAGADDSTITDDMCDAADDIEELGAPQAAQGVRSLSADAAAFERSLRQILVSAQPRQARGGGRFGGPAPSASSSSAAASPSVERIDALLADPFMRSDAIVAGITSVCRKAVAKGRAFRSRSTTAAAGPPLPMRLVDFARKRRRAAIFECMKQRANEGGAGGGHKSFRFGAAGGGATAKVTVGAPRYPVAHGGGNPLEPVETNRLGRGSGDVPTFSVRPPPALVVGGGGGGARLGGLPAMGALHSPPTGGFGGGFGSGNGGAATARKRDVSPVGLPKGVAVPPVSARRTMSVL